MKRKKWSKCVCYMFQCICFGTKLLLGVNDSLKEKCLDIGPLKASLESSSFKLLPVLIQHPLTPSLPCVTSLDPTPYALS